MTVGNERTLSNSKMSPLSSQRGAEPRDQTEHEADGERRADRKQGHLERDLPAHEHAREDVTAELVGAEKMLRRGRLQLIGNVDLVGLERGKPVGPDRAHQNHHHHRQPQSAEGLAHDSLEGQPERGPCAQGSDGGCMCWHRRSYSSVRSRGSTTALTRSETVVLITNSTVVTSTAPITTG